MRGLQRDISTTFSGIRPHEFKKKSVKPVVRK